MFVFCEEGSICITWQSDRAPYHSSCVGHAPAAVIKCHTQKQVKEDSVCSAYGTRGIEFRMVREAWQQVQELEGSHFIYTPEVGGKEEGRRGCAISSLCPLTHFL